MIEMWVLDWLEAQPITLAHIFWPIRLGQKSYFFVSVYYDSIHAKI
jgi:hypothetical protein